MMTVMVLNRPCPLCGAATQSNPLNMGHQRHYLCPRCTEFVIDVHGETHIAGMPLEMREQMAAAARGVDEDHIFVITIANIKDGLNVSGVAMRRDKKLR